MVKTKYIFLCVVMGIISIASSASDIQPPVERCKNALKIAEAGLSSEYAIVGDCFYYGVFFEKDYEEAKFYYLQATLNESNYGKLKLGRMYLFESETKLSKALGFYFLKDISDRKNTEYRGDSRYSLAVFFAGKKDYELASRYLALGIEDENIDAVFANTYLKIQKNNSDMSLRSEIENSLLGATKLQKKLLGREAISFSCWVKSQETRTMPFPNQHEINQKIFSLFGLCEN